RGEQLADPGRQLGVAEGVLLDAGVFPLADPGAELLRQLAQQAQVVSGRPLARLGGRPAGLSQEAPLVHRLASSRPAATSCQLVVDCRCDKLAAWRYGSALHARQSQVEEQPAQPLEGTDVALVRRRLRQSQLPGDLAVAQVLEV